VSIVVLGLDLSLASTGLATYSSELGYQTRALKPPTRRSHGHDRLEWLLQTVESEFRHAHLVVVEGPSYGSANRGQRGHHERAGLWWLVTHALWLRMSQVAVAPPAAVKRYATGKGNASKDTVLREVTRRFADFHGGNDEADALILAALAAEHLGHPIVEMPAAHRTALTAVEWPELMSP
jgi:crossover junction endodeoxyribonuclease RuvC